MKMRWELLFLDNFYKNYLETIIKMRNVIKILVLFLLSALLLSCIWWFVFRKPRVLTYLKKVYPNADWNKVSNSDIIEFYDSLGFIYNPCSEYIKDDLTSINDNPNDKNTNQYGKNVCGTMWKNLNSCKKYGPPRPPKGNLLSFNHYHKDNQHTVNSDGTGDMKDWTSYRQTLHWGLSATAGEISRTCRSGPGPYWVPPFSIVRDFYYPNGIKFSDGKWSIKCNMSPKLKNNGCEWNIPNNWTSGYKEGDYIEVTHSQNNPGMPQSVGFWFSGFPGGGTGIFLKIGKTHIANNKIDSLFTLIVKLKNISADDLYYNMKNTKFVNKSGSEILNHYYNTDDPYTITWGYANGEWNSMSYVNDGQTSLVDPSADSWKWIGNKGILNASGLMKDPTNINVNIEDGHGYVKNMTVKFSDIAKWWLTIKRGDPTLDKSGKKMIIDAARNPSEDIDYFPNRAGGMVPPDEPICWLAFVLGIETIQMPMSSNDNGLWVYEIIDLRPPTPENTPGFPNKYNNWLDQAKERIYNWIEPGPNWLPDAQGWWMRRIEQFLSSRDPLNLDVGDNCQNIAYISGLDEEECNNPFQYIQSVPTINTSGYFDKEKRCWVSIIGGGWQNFPCIKDSMSQEYIKIPLMYPAINKTHQ